MKKNKRAIIFYKDHSNLINKYILKKINFNNTIVVNPYLKIYFVPLIKTLLNFNFNLRNFFYEYWKNVLIYYKIDCCITAIDNSGFFQKLAFLSNPIKRKIFFFSIQNGLRRKNLNLPDYNSIHFCHGNYDEKLLNKINKNKGEIIKTGSFFYNLKYKKSSKKKKLKKVLSFISQVDSNAVSCTYKENPNNYIIKIKTKFFLKHIKKFLNENKNFFLNILTFENSFQEKNFYKNSLSGLDNYKIIEKKNHYDNYRFIDVSDCNITINSTLGFESLVCNKVIFLDNYFVKSLKPDLFGNPSFILREKSYDQFKKKIVFFSNMKYNKFLKNYKNEISYFMYKKNQKALEIIKSNIIKKIS